MATGELVKGTRTRFGRAVYANLLLDLEQSIRGGEFSVGQQLPTELELAQRYSISRISVRRALQILAERGLLDRLQGKGTFVASHTETSPPADGKRVALWFTLTGLFRRTFDSAWLYALEDVAHSYGYACEPLMMHASRPDESKLVGLVREFNLRAILLLDPMDIKDITKLLDSGVPVVWQDNELIPSTIPTVRPDYEGDACVGVTRLLHAGRRRIGLIPGQRGRTSTVLAREGARLALRLAGEDPASLHVWEKLDHWPVEADLPEIIAALVERGGCDGIYVRPPNALADSLIRSLLERGVRVPKDVAVVSCATINNRANEDGPVPVTTLEYDMATISRLAMDMTIRLAEGLPVDNTKIYLPSKLVVRESCP